jgi:plasmid maintenance system killer protein
LQLKAAAPKHYQHRLLVRAFTAWQDRTAAKQHAEQQRRLAVRHRYLCTLGKVLQAWKEAVKAAGHKQQMSAAAQQHFEHKLLITVVQVSACCVMRVQHQWYLVPHM